MIWILWAIAIWLTAAKDSEKYTKWRAGGMQGPSPIGHARNTIERFIVALVLFAVFNREDITIAVVIFYTMGCFFSYWLFFNILFNKFSGLAWDHVGTEAWLDKMERKIPSPTIVMLGKAFFALVGIYTYYNTHLL